MQKRDFDALWAVLCARWKWPDGSETASKAFYTELWAKVMKWTGPWEEAFRQAVWELKASDRYGMPTPSQIVGLAAQHIPRKKTSPAAERANTLASRFRGYYEQGWINFRSSSAYICQWVGCKRGEMDALWAANFLDVQCPKCMFRTVYVLRRLTEVEETRIGTKWAPTEMYQLECCECGHDFVKRLKDKDSYASKYEEPVAPEDPPVPGDRPWQEFVGKGYRAPGAEETEAKRQEALTALQEHEPEATEADLDRVEELPDDFDDPIPF